MSRLLKTAVLAAGLAGFAVVPSASAGWYGGYDGGYYGGYYGVGYGGGCCGHGYYGGYYPHHHYSYGYTSCCYERTVRYRRVYAEPYYYGGPYRHAYYDPYPYGARYGYGGGYYGGGYYGVGAYGWGPRRYYYGGW